MSGSLNSAPRLNHPSLVQMAKRMSITILSSGFKSKTLEHISDYLTQLISHIESKTLDLTELVQLEKNLETIEVALVHLWISPPYNGCLYIPNKLTYEQVDLLRELLHQNKVSKRHLKIAYSQAA